MIIEYDSEPVRGLPGNLPADERILWQGSPDWRTLMIDAYHIRAVAGYFGVLILWALVAGNALGALITLGVGAAGLAVLALLALAAARSSVYTLTNKRVVLRIGIALPKCINVPLSQMTSVDIDAKRDGHANIALSVSGAQRLGWIALWPHARPWRLNRVEPMLRCLSDGQDVAALLARCAKGAAGQTQPATAAPLAVAA